MADDVDDADFEEEPDEELESDEEFPEDDDNFLVEDDDDAVVDDDAVIVDDDALVIDVEEEATPAAPARRGKEKEKDKDKDKEESEEEDDDEEEDGEDVEASLDVILKERLVVEEPEDDDDEEEGTPEHDDRGDSNRKVAPRRPDEFVCQSCFLVKHPSQLADKARQLCNDCV